MVLVLGALCACVLGDGKGASGNGSPGAEEQVQDDCRLSLGGAVTGGIECTQAASIDTSSGEIAYGVVGANETGNQVTANFIFLEGTVPPEPGTYGMEDFEDVSVTLVTFANFGAMYEEQTVTLTLTAVDGTSLDGTLDAVLVSMLDGAAPTVTVHAEF
ncbi:MAG: hypothetical protein JW751_25820 [Polyangiaceae bacterium]|nr:hypothetical protein [Polyangiaceae bacterium]